jgi:predicted DNA-binding transcriptional regulator AlpA
MLNTSGVSQTAMSVALHADDDTLLTSNQVRARVGNVSHMCLWRWMRDERVLFPQPIQINRRNYWRLGDLRRWQAARTQKAAA